MYFTSLSGPAQLLVTVAYCKVGRGLRVTLSCTGLRGGDVFLVGRRDFLHLGD